MVSRCADGSGQPPRFGDGDARAALYKDIRTRMSARDFETWFEATPCEFRRPDRFVFTALNRFRKAWMEKNYRDLVRDAARQVFAVEARVEFQVDPASPPPQAPPPPCEPPSAALDECSTDSLSLPPLDDAAAPQLRSPPKDLNALFTFENFVPGPPNRVAHAAAIAVSERPGPSYNPLFLYGDRGVGKTHLLQSICHRLIADNRLKVAYFTGEGFTSEFVAAVSDSAPEPFRVKCREADVLVIDDVHFLGHKERTQDELFHTLNAVLGHDKQVVVSAVCLPREIPGLQERLISRFRAGLVSRLERADYELRVGVLMRKARAYDQNLPMEVAEFIAKHIVDDLREVEGALARVVSVASLHQAPLSVEVARTALRELLEEEQVSGTISVSQILEAVQGYYNVRPKDLLSRSKVRTLVYARQIGMYLARDLTPLSLEGIGAHFGGRDHTTVLYAIDRIQARLKTTPRVRGDLQLLKSRISAMRSV